MNTIVRILLAALGITLLWCSTFLYQDEEGRLQNKLADWWQDAEALRQRSGSAFAAFFQTVAVRTDRALAGLFGARLMSWRFVAVSFCATILVWDLALADKEADIRVATHAVLALISIILASHLFGSHVWPATTLVVSTALAWVVRWYLALNFVEMDRFYTFVGRPAPRHGLAQDVLMMLTFAGQSAPGGGEVLFLLAIVLVSATCDVVSVAIARYVIRLVIQTHTPARLLRLVALSAAVPMIFVAGPIVAANYIQRAWIGDPVAMISLTNVYTSVVFVVFLFFAFLMLMHRMFWTLIQRPLYAAHRFGLVTQHKVLATAGVSLLGLSFPRVGHWVGAVLHGVFQ